MRMRFLILLVIVPGFSLNAQVPFKKVKVNKAIQLQLPQEFLPMSELEQQQKYVSNQPPIATFTNRDGTVDLGINITSTSWGNDLSILRQFYRSGISSLYDEVRFTKDTILTINQRDFIAFEFVGMVRDEQNSFMDQGSLSKYVYIVYTPYNDRLLLFNFSSPARTRGDWAPIAAQIMSTIQIRE